MKPCLYCGNALENRRANYHEECKAPAKEAAKASQRRCKKCKKVRAASAFVNDETRVDGKFPWCVDCQNKYRSDHRFQNPDDDPNGFICPLDDTVIRGHKNRRYCSTGCKDRVKALSRDYGLDVADYRRLVEATGGRCPICQNRVNQWHVDHNHKTRMVTGVVCAPCNVGSLASTYHDIKYVERLLAFLKSTPAAQLGIESLAPEGATKPSNLHTVWRGRKRAVGPA